MALKNMGYQMMERLCVIAMMTIPRLYKTGGGDCFIVSIDNAGDVLDNITMCKVSDDPTAGTLGNMSVGIQLQP